MKDLNLGQDLLCTYDSLSGLSLQGSSIKKIHAHSNPSFLLHVHTCMFSKEKAALIFFIADNKLDLKITS